MKQADIVKNPQVGGIYHLEPLDDDDFVLIFRFLPSPKKNARLTGCDGYIFQSRSSGDMYRERHVGFLGFDDEIKVLKPANKNEIAIFNRAFGL